MGKYNWNIFNILKNSHRSLIDYANLKNNIYLPQINFCNKKDFSYYIKKKYLGLPILIDYNNQYFNFNKKDTLFKLSKEQIANKIFKTKKLNYIGVKLLFRNITFSQYATPKKKYFHIIHSINQFNNLTKRNIDNLKKRKVSIASFQTRNIPHIGHQRIIEHLFKYADIVVINPILGPKKKGDVKSLVLKNSWDFLIKKYYKNKVYFYPMIANMLYAGPLEAIHHTIMRQNYNFDYFCVGRDHAGADNIYNPEAAPKLLDQYKTKFKIKIINIKGAFFCLKCNKAVVKGNCKHSSKNLTDISGTIFRKKLEKKRIYQYADIDLQKYLFSKFNNLFQ